MCIILGSSKRKFYLIIWVELNRLAVAIDCFCPITRLERIISWHHGRVFRFRLTLLELDVIFPTNFNIKSKFIPKRVSWICFDRSTDTDLCTSLLERRKYRSIGIQEIR